MSEMQRPAAWIIAKPSALSMGEAQRVFGALCQTLTDSVTCNVPHLTLEILYPPLADVEHIERALAGVAQAAMPIEVPALGVVYEASDAMCVELARTSELVALRRQVAESLRSLGATVDPRAAESWRPHLSVLGREHPDLKVWSRVAPHSAVTGFSFQVASLILSRPTSDPRIYRESRPYWLGAVAAGRASQARHSSHRV